MRKSVVPMSNLVWSSGTTESPLLTKFLLKLDEIVKMNKETNYDFSDKPCAV